MDWLWLFFIWPLVSFSVGGCEALMHLDDLSEGRQRIADVRATVDATGEWPKVAWWSYREDPLGGLLDFASRPWVSAARGSGDCEDAMLLAEGILSGHDTRRAYVSRGGRGHSLLLWRNGSYWYIIDNMVCLPIAYDTPEEAGRDYYGDQTEVVIIY